VLSYAAWHVTGTHEVPYLNIYSPINSVSNLRSVTSIGLVSIALLALSLNCEDRLLSSTCLSRLSFCPSARRHGTTRFLLDGFSWNLIFYYFSKSVEKIKFLLITEKNKATLHEDRHMYIVIIITVLYMKTDMCTLW
jgi:hypothetical protein